MDPARITGHEPRNTGHAVFGLCADCRHAQRVESSRGSVFLLCGLSKTEPSFPKYPRLPMLSCSGYAKKQKEEPEQKSKSL